MDSLIGAAARALACGDALTALKQVALRDDPPALALRGIAMAQLGELARARALLRRAARGFGPREPLAQARCRVAEAEVALALRDLATPDTALAAAMATLQAQGDIPNATHARLITARRALLLGRPADAAALLAPLQGQTLAPLQAATAALAAVELALRDLQLDAAEAALREAHEAATRAAVPALQAEAADAAQALSQVAARRWQGGTWQPLKLADVAALFRAGGLVVDACRHGLRVGDWQLRLARRPVLFTLLRTLAQAWPDDASREQLIADAFRLREPDDTHRARLRVEIGRLRRLVADVAEVQATPGGFRLRPHRGRDVAVLAPPVDGAAGELLALLSDGAAWSTSALAQAVGDSQRTVQRALAELQAQGRVRAVGQARAQRWLAPPLTGFTTILLLPAALPSG
jgi:hypothetical protein